MSIKGKMQGLCAWPRHHEPPVPPALAFSFQPAFRRAAERFGVKLLIVALEPVSGPIDWYSYPARVMPLVEQSLNGAVGGV
jgi:hypothetical protein